ncbi:prion-inhibition and propagation-domain-containing protein [Apiospora arundinis]|uniref:Prion-inhibition and propagation-domain-containing protein n=1 Tax=Apiospora arundinis TaxID=335852 RepID=A0ABR2IAG9_9PEZI
MAEIFGTVAGALSVAALFTDCVDWFEYIQLGRHFGHDFERCRLKLAIAQTRLSRWGKAVAIHDDPRFASTSPVDAPMQQVQSVLEEIELLFRSIRKKSQRYELGKTPADLEVLQDSGMQPVARQLHQHLRETVLRRQRQTSLAKKATWALYDGKQFDNIIEQIVGFVDDLEAIWPVEAPRRQLVQVEIEEINDEPALEAIQDAATCVDSVLAEAAERKAAVIAGKNHAGQVGTHEQARVRIGNEYAFAKNSSGLGGFADQTSNTADTVDARGMSRVHIGASYGGRGIFDD